MKDGSLFVVLFVMLVVGIFIGYRLGEKAERAKWIQPDPSLPSLEICLEGGQIVPCQPL